MMITKLHGSAKENFLFNLYFKNIYLIWAEFLVSCGIMYLSGGSLEQVCVGLVLGSKFVQFRIICSLLYSITFDTF